MSSNYCTTTESVISKDSITITELPSATQFKSKFYDHFYSMLSAIAPELRAIRKLRRLPPISDNTSSSLQYTVLAAWLVLSVDNMKTSPSGREPLNGVAEPGRDLLEIDVFDVTKSVRAKNRCNTSRFETAGPTFINFLKLFGPLRYQFPHLF